jgi:murein DD-endopeptidase MepM/ murein hydrolase activator NlpD
MAAGMGVGGVSRRAVARRPMRPSGRSTAVLWALGGLLLVACSGCSSRPEPTPLMTDTLLLKPVDQGRLSSGFGLRYHPIMKRRQWHRGIDWAAPRGTPVRAAGRGVVVAAGRLGAYGQYLRIDHGDTIATAYAHLERYAPGLRPGRAVAQGEVIGLTGSTGRATGPHLHYEVLVAGRHIDPLAFASTILAQAPAPAPIPAASAPGSLGIGGPDASAAARADPARPDAGSPALDVINGSTVIRVADLLRRSP